MKRFMLLHFGFEPPTAEIMSAWQKWFESIADIVEENGGFHGGAVEITKAGAEPLSMAADSITGFSIIKAENLEAAQAIAAANPFVASIRVYEIVSG